MKKVLIIFTVIFLGFSVATTIESVATSAEISSLKDKEIKLRAKKSELESVLVSTISTSSIEDMGEVIGFSKPQDLMYIESPSNVASKN